MRLDTAINRTVTIFLLLIVFAVVLILPSKEYLSIKATTQIAKESSLNQTSKQIEFTVDKISNIQMNIGIRLLNFIKEHRLLTIVIIFLCVITGMARGWIGKLRDLIN